MKRGRVLYSLLWLVASQLCVFSLGKAEPRRVPILFHVVRVSGEPVADEPFLAAQLSSANEIYGPLGFELFDAGRHEVPARHASLVSRADRDALARFVRRGVINCMVVSSLMDVDEPGRERRGVHWRVRNDGERHFVIVSRISGPYVLAHELGHFFGNQAHSDTPGNLMSYTRTNAPPFLEPMQVKTVLGTLDAMLRRKELIAR